MVESVVADDVLADEEVVVWFSKTIGSISVFRLSFSLKISPAKNSNFSKFVLLHLLP
ncbi:hypothetical protein HanXRQr2_Chr09g0389901 [Helianthus annuus]|uniref:Uncharacterized protein n=1 Tax=Helianthus annuus TaxID=4232 RepID=A0A9K3N8E9_HELAN|nr:hypothetical protein HanXRQr2_Chr09g0389901 [Helianthus annuus]KAJ0893273.1 hypothetical protein HanPSC8_Chr09g0375771 [Helianthus annuus]